LPSPMNRHRMSARPWRPIWARKKQAPLAPRLKVSEGDSVTKIALDHLEPAIGLGTSDPDFLDGLLANSSSRIFTTSRPA
jgi:hypothetical protein